MACSTCSARRWMPQWADRRPDTAYGTKLLADGDWLVIAAIALHTQLAERWM